MAGLELTPTGRPGGILTAWDIAEGCHKRATLSVCPYDVIQRDDRLYLRLRLDILPEGNGTCIKQQLSLIQCSVVQNWRGHLLSRRTEYICTQRAIENPVWEITTPYWGMVAAVCIRGDIFVNVNHLSRIMLCMSCEAFPLPSWPRSFISSGWRLPISS